MKRFAKSVLGVTLLEIMLVLAIAAMIIVMSVRYYQSASVSQQGNAVVAAITTIVASASSLSQASGTYSGVTQTQIACIVGTSGMSTPWGGSTYSIAATATGITVTVPNAPAGVCSLIQAKFKADAHYNATASTCTPGTLGSVVISYTANA